MDELEAHPAGLDSEDLDESGGGSKLALLAMVVGAIGIILGIAGIYMAAQATNALEDYREEAASQPDTSGPRIDALEERVEQRLEEVGAQLSSIEERLGNMGSAQVSLQRNAREMREQTQQAFEGVSREVAANRSQINDTTSKLEELISNLQSGAVRRSAPAGAASSSSRNENASSGGGSGAAGGSGGGSDAGGAETGGEAGAVHIVASGDTLSSIASRYGVTLAAVMEANPTVDPRRMRVGQEIVIPGQ